jgi:Holliday junction resolvasome RuvABC endonuclease subunit
MPRQLVIGIDPGSGVASPTGLSVFDVETREILLADNLGTRHKALQHRIKDISDQLEDYIKQVITNYPDASIIVAVEYFVMLGKGGEILNRLIGSFMGRLPYNIEFTQVQNTTVKRLVGGHGRAEKQQVAAGLLPLFSNNETSMAQIMQLTSEAEWDILDSLAIGVSAWLIKQNEIPKIPTKPKRRRS